MTDWSVTVQTRAPGEGPNDTEQQVPPELEAAADRLMTALERQSGVVTYGRTSWGATITVLDSPLVTALGAALADVTIAARRAGLPSWPVVRLEVVDHVELAAELARPQ